MTFQEFLDTTLLPSLLTIAVTLVTVLTGMATDAIRKWGQAQKTEATRKILEAVADAADRAVAATTQTFAQAMREPDGTLNPKAAAEAFSMAMVAAREQLGAEGLALLARLLGGEGRANQVLTTMIESAVQRQKVERVTAEAFMRR